MIISKTIFQGVYRVVWVLMLSTFFHLTYAQNPLLENGKFQFRLNSEGTEYIQLTFLNQVWLRHTQCNPGSEVFDDPVSQVTDIGLRRIRLQLFGKVSEKIFFYTQFGQNNYSYLSPRFAGAFFHDAIVEYYVHERSLHIGGGLTGWSGLSRYASPSAGTALSLDVPLFQQTTNSISDQFLRKLSIYAKGKIERLDYRIALTKPLVTQNAIPGVNTISAISEFSSKTPRWQAQGYFAYQFLEEESNLTPYTVGTYLGNKKIFNIGAGFVYQPKALWSLENITDTVYHSMALAGVDIFYDSPVRDGNNAITFYASYHYFNFGPGYIRNIGVMNPANALNDEGSFNGTGNAFPMIGTGNIFYGQLGYLLRKNPAPSPSWQPYMASQLAYFERLDEAMMMWEAGINWFIRGTHQTKLSLNYQSRPIFEIEPSDDITSSLRKGMAQIQFQIAI